MIKLELRLLKSLRGPVTKSGRSSNHCPIWQKAGSAGVNININNINKIIFLYIIYMQILIALARCDQSVSVSRFEEPFDKFLHFARLRGQRGVWRFLKLPKKVGLEKIMKNRWGFLIKVGVTFCRWGLGYSHRSKCLIPTLSC